MPHTDTAPPAPGLPLWRGKVLPEWLDYNGHMTEFRYLQVFGESSDALYARLQMNFDDARTGAYYTLETHIRHRAEARLGVELHSHTQILAYDEKRLHLWHALYAPEGLLLATGEHLVLHMAHGASGPADPAVLARVAAIFDAQATLPLPEDSGRVLRKALTHRRGG